MFAFLISFAFTVALTPLIIYFCRSNNLFDRIEERSSHNQRIPRLGGFLFLPAVGLSIVITMILDDESIPITSIDSINHSLFFKPLLVLKASTFLIALGAILIYLLGVVDDLKNVKAKQKFIVQFLVAIVIPSCDLYINNLYGLFGLYQIPIYIGYPITVLLILLIINAINLIDGIDGLAASLSLFILLVFAWQFTHRGGHIYAIPANALAGCLAGFLLYNLFGTVRSGTKIFMGDSGSLFLGFSLSYFALKLSMDNRAILQYDPDSLLIGFTLLFLPTADLLRVAIERRRKGFPVFQADKTHIHHQLMHSGLSMMQTLCTILCLEVLFCVFNYFCFYCMQIGVTYIIVFDVLVFIFINLILVRCQQEKSN